MGTSAAGARESRRKLPTCRVWGRGWGWGWGHRTGMGGGGQAGCGIGCYGLLCRRRAHAGCTCPPRPSRVFCTRYPACLIATPGPGALRLLLLLLLDRPLRSAALCTRCCCNGAPGGLRPRTRRRLRSGRRSGPSGPGHPWGEAWASGRGRSTCRCGALVDLGSAGAGEGEGGRGAASARKPRVGGRSQHSHI